MNRYPLIFLIFLVLISCNEKMDHRVVENLDEYAKAKDYLIKNQREIDESRHYTRHDSLMRVTYNTIFAANKYYFENTLIPNYPGLNDLIKLWDNNLIDHNKVVHALVLTSDSIVKFTIKSDIGVFSGTSHKLVFDKNRNAEKQAKNNSEILMEEQFGDGWTYIIEKKYYAY